MGKKRNVPGTDVKHPGKYDEYDKDGNKTDRSYDLDRDDVFPPTQNKDSSFRKRT